MGSRHEPEGPVQVHRPSLSVLDTPMARINTPTSNSTSTSSPSTPRQLRSPRSPSPTPSFSSSSSSSSASPSPSSWTSFRSAQHSSLSAACSVSPPPSHSVAFGSLTGSSKDIASFTPSPSSSLCPSSTSVSSFTASSLPPPPPFEPSTVNLSPLPAPTISPTYPSATSSTDGHLMVELDLEHDDGPSLPSSFDDQSPPLEKLPLEGCIDGDGMRTRETMMEEDLERVKILVGGQKAVLNKSENDDATPKVKGVSVLWWFGTGIFVFNCLSAYMQELLFNVEGYTFGFFLTLVKLICNAFLAGVYLRFRPPQHKQQKSGSLQGSPSLLEDLEGGNSKLTNSATLDLTSSSERKLSELTKLRRGSQGPVPRSSVETLPSPRADAPRTEKKAEDDVVAKQKGRVPMREYVLLALCSVMATGLSSASLTYLHYPTKVILKASKVVVIMALGRFITGKRYSSTEYGLAMAMVFGLLLFTTGDLALSSQAKPEVEIESGALEGMPIAAAEVPDNDIVWKTVKGLLMIAGSLAFESFNVNYQKRILQTYELTSPAEMIYHLATIGCVLTVGITLVTAELFSAIAFVWTHLECLLYIFGFSLFGSAGTACVLLVIHHFDPMVAAMIITARKGVTVLSSYILIPKPVTVQHVLGGVLVFGSMFANAVLKNTTAPGGTSTKHKPQATEMAFRVD